jgi:hypothetical protein
VSSIPDHGERRGDKHSGGSERELRGSARRSARLTHGCIALLDTVLFESGGELAHVLFETRGGDWAAAAVELPGVQNAAHVDALEANGTIGDTKRCFKRVFAWLHLKMTKKRFSVKIFFFFFFFHTHEKWKKKNIKNTKTNERQEFRLFFFLYIYITYRITCSLNGGINRSANGVVVSGGAVIVGAIGTIRHTGGLKHLFVALARALRRQRRAARQRQNEN